MEEELEILQSIYLNDILSIDLKNEQSCIEVLIYPTFSENDEENKKNIIMTLVIKLSKNYPSEIPSFEFKNVKGILEQDLDIIRSKIIEIANRNIGDQMLFEIIQEIKDFLTTYENVPKNSKCSICLSPFEKSNNVTHLNCYHYFHTSCLKTYLNFTLSDIEKEKQEAEYHKIKWVYRTVCCPECRQEMTDDQIDILKKTGDIIVDENEEANEKIVISLTMRRMQEKMKKLIEKQRMKGGIIEPKEENIISLNRSNDDQTGQQNLD